MMFKYDVLLTHYVSNGYVKVADFDIYSILKAMRHYLLRYRTIVFTNRVAWLSEALKELQP